jgi:VWFA-related protein
MREWKSRSIAVLATPAFLLTTVFAQSLEPTLTIRSNTRLVQLSVIAVDRNGRPVTGLTREDFELYDQGRLQQVRIFTEDSIRKEPAPGHTTVVANSAAHVFTNIVDTRSAPSSVTVILFDSLNTEWTHQAYARREVLRFLSQLRPEDHVALYVMSYGGARVLHDFTQDPSELIAKLDKFRGEVGTRHASTDQGLDRQFEQWMNGRSREYTLRQRLADSPYFAPVQSLRILTAIANRLADIPGRKNVIWISDGFPVVLWGSLLDAVFGGNADSIAAASQRAGAEAASIYDEMNLAMRTVSNANVAIYPVSAEGLDNRAYDAQSNVEPTHLIMGMDAKLQALENAMDDIAKKTGGRAFYETNDIAGAIRKAVDDSNTTYTLGFYPDSVRLDGKFHKIRLRIVGRDGVRLRYRQGYIDAPELWVDENNYRLSLENAVWSPLDANGIGLSANIEPTPGAGHKERLQLKISASDLTFVELGTTRVAEAELLVCQKDDRGKQLNVIEHVVRVEASTTDYDEITKNGIAFSGSFLLQRDTRSLRIVVSDARSARLGSLTIPRAALTH